MILKEIVGQEQDSTFLEGALPCLTTVLAHCKLTQQQYNCWRGRKGSWSVFWPSIVGIFILYKPALPPTVSPPCKAKQASMSCDCEPPTATMPRCRSRRSQTIPRVRKQVLDASKMQKKVFPDSLLVELPPRGPEDHDVSLFFVQLSNEATINLMPQDHLPQATNTETVS